MSAITDEAVADIYRSIFKPCKEVLQLMVIQPIQPSRLEVGLLPNSEFAKTLCREVNLRF